MASPSTNDLTRQQLEELDALLQRMLAGSSVKADVQKPLELPRESPVPFPPDSPLVLSARVPVPAPVPMPPSARDTIVDKLTERVDSSSARREPPPQPEMPAPIVSRLPAPQPIRREEAAPQVAAWLRTPTPDEPTLAPIKPPTVPVTPAVAYEPPMPTIQDIALPSLPEPTVPQFGRVEANTHVPETPVNLMPVTTVAEEPVSEVTNDASTSSGVPVFLWPVFAVNWIAESILKVFGGDALVTAPAKTLMGWTGILLLVGAGVWSAYGYGYLAPPK